MANAHVDAGQGRREKSARAHRFRFHELSKDIRVICWHLAINAIDAVLLIHQLQNLDGGKSEPSRSLALTGYHTSIHMRLKT